MRQLSSLLESKSQTCHIPETLMSGPSLRILRPWTRRQALKSTSSMKHGPWPMVTGKKLQAPSCKPEAPSAKLQATSSNNSEISSQLREGHGPWPLDISSWIMDPGISFTEHGPRVRARINVCLGWATCHEI